MRPSPAPPCCAAANPSTIARGSTRSTHRNVLLPRLAVGIERTLRSRTRWPHNPHIGWVPPRSFLHAGSAPSSASSRNVSSKVAIDEREDSPCRPRGDRAGMTMLRPINDDDIVQTAVGLRTRRTLDEGGSRLVDIGSRAQFRTAVDAYSGLPFHPRILSRSESVHYA